MINNSRDLIERDPALPGMARLLADPRIDYLRYKPGTSLTVGLPGPDGPAFGYAVSEEAARKLDKLVGKAPAGAVLEHDRRRRVLIAEPIADRDLPGLRQPMVRGAQMLAYKPQRRWVGRSNRDLDRVIRCYRRADLRQALSRWPQQGVQNQLRIPNIIGHEQRTGMMITQRLAGVRLDRLSDGCADAGWLAVGRALGHWHLLARSGGPRAALPEASAVAELLSVLLPESAGRFRRLADRLPTPSASASNETAPSESAEQGWCHGDFSADQVLIDASDHRPALLDWDRSGRGPVAFDLGSADAAGRGADDSTIGLSSADWQALIAGYTEVRELPVGLDRYRALAWFVRAVEPFRRADPEWPTAVLERVQRAEELLG